MAESEPHGRRYYDRHHPQYELTRQALLTGGICQDVSKSIGFDRAPPKPDKNQRQRLCLA